MSLILRLFASEDVSGNYKADYVIESGLALFLGGMKLQHWPVDSVNK
jgi:hypothetical protein